MSQKENQRVALTKRLLQEGLLRLLKEKSIYKINVTELCQESGINRATFYKHYQTPFDVLTDMGDSMAQEFMASQDLEAFRENPDHGAFLTDMCRYLFQHAEKMKVLIQYNMDDEISNLFNAIPQSRALLEDCLKDNFEKSEVPLVSTFIYSGSYHLIRRWIMEGIPKSPEEIAEILFRLGTSGWGKG